MEKVKILVVEDECIIAQSLCRSLERLEYTTLASVAFGEKAISLAEKHNPDLVLMDIILKGEMDGIETAGILRSRFNIPVIYVTSCMDQNTRERAQTTKPLGYMIKPVRERDLRNTIETALLDKKLEFLKPHEA
ncbi:MAG TPA: response regulator [Nitrospinota bacterium]|nr:response regulator [Nitrospinota bacterium]